MINKRLVYVLESRYLLPEKQYGFRIIPKNNIAEVFRRKESTTIVSLDISKAYDMSLRYTRYSKKSKTGR
jgi:hypothetical protein